MRSLISRRGFLAQAGAGAAAVILAACQPKVVEKVVKETVVVEKVVKETVVVEAPKPAEEKHEITFAWWTGGESANKIFEESMDRFELSHPNYTLHRMPITGEFSTKMLTMYGAGNAPDCHGVGWGVVWHWAHKGILLDLTPLIDRDSAEIDWDDQWLAVTDGCYYPPGEKIIALPRETFGLQLVSYNKTIYEEGGLDTPDKAMDAGNWTWATWREQAKALSRFDASGRREIMGANQGAGYWDLQFVMPSLGVSMFNQAVTHFNIDDPKVIAWLEMLADMMTKDRSLGKPEETKEFDWGSSGKQAIKPTATWEFPNMRQTWADIDWDFVAPPKGDGGHSNFVGCDYHCVNGSDYADQEGGWELIKFLGSAREDLWWALNMFGAPFRKSNLDAWITQVNQILPKKGWKYVIKATEGATPWTPLPFQDELNHIHGNEIGQALLGERPAAEVCQSIADKVEKMIAEFE